MLRAQRLRDYLTRDEAAQLLRAANESPRHRVRNHAMILLAYRHPRGFECVGLHDGGGGRAIGSDNGSLSLPIQIGENDHLQPRSASNVPAMHVAEAVPAPRSVADYVAAAATDNTRRAYQNDLRAFLEWGGSLPASPAAIANYLAAQAAVLSPVTLARRLVAIGRAHTTLGHANPCQADLVRTALRGIWRVHGRPQRQVEPALREDILAMLPHMTGTRGIRDRALILIGFAGALRRSELVALQFDDITFVKLGLTTLIRRSKTDQFAEGRKIGIPFARSHACPVTALAAWLDHAAIESGPLFRLVNKGGGVGNTALSAQSVAIIVKNYARKAGLPAANYSGHSHRAGLITSAAKAGVSSWKIRQQTGHKSDAMLQRYIRDADVFEGNAAGSIL